MIKDKNKIGIMTLLTITIFSLVFFNWNIPQTFGINCDNYDECQNKADTLRKLIEIKTQRQNTLQDQLKLIDLEQQKNRAELKDTQDIVATLADQIANLEKEISENGKRMDYEKTMLSSLMQVYYEDSQQGVLNIVLANRDFSDILSQSSYVEQSSLKVGEVLNSIKEIKDKLEANKAELDIKKQESDAAKEKLQDRNLNLQYSEDQKQVLLDQTQADKAKYEKSLRDVEDEIEQLSSAKGEADTSNLPPLKKGYFTYPVNPAVISQGYGKTDFSNHYTTGKHNGVDFSVKYKSVYAAKDGKVIATGNNGRYGYGRWVAINHGDGLVTLYGHFSKVSVSKGESVSEGETIGTSGNTGYSTGPHLHFSVFSASSFEVVESKTVSGLMLPTGSSVNPMRYLK